MKARVVDDLIETIEAALPREGHRHDEVFLALARRIQGREVTLRFIGDDAFEAQDDNYWLPRSCWEPVNE